MKTLKMMLPVVMLLGLFAGCKKDIDVLPTQDNVINNDLFKATSASTIYIAPNGNDATGNGTSLKPYFTLIKAWSIVQPGGIIYMRGGKYAYNSVQALTGKNGTSVNKITVMAYPGEVPNITKSSSYITPSWPNALVRITANYTHWKGIEISGYTQKGADVGHAFTLHNGNNNTFEQINSHHNNHGMLIIGNCTNNTVLNSDFHHNYDPSPYPGRTIYGDGDGIEIANIPAGSVNTIKGSRSWSNADDGFDMYRNDGFITIENCWAWSNGYREDGVTTGGNGEGIKLGRTSGDYGGQHLRTVKNCLVFHNRAGGITTNGMKCVGWIFNNVAYHNADGASVYALNFQFAEAGTTRRHILRNNIAYANQHPKNLQANFTNCVTSNNTWNGGVVVTDSDFLSVSSVNMDGKRQANGSLPVTNFLKLVRGSDLIDKGINVGLPFSGTRPDIGAYEFLN
ncbi:MAG: hypothetical protein HGA25_11555 [Clostridiales bacterium]|nr:hypothetical protein [Clostridiales bacterium]